MKTEKKIAYFIGIAGKAMSQLAKAFKDMGWQVSGSDQENIYPPVSDYLKKNKISFFRGYRPQNVPLNADLIIVGRSPLLINSQNPEYLKAEDTGALVLSYPEVLQKYLIKENSIVIAGTYGKTTITALAAWIMQQAGLNPSYMIGGIMANMLDGLKITDSSYSVVEGDEAPALKENDPPKFMYYQPKYLLLTSTKWDHPEIYKSENEYLIAFIKLAELLPEDGLLVYNIDSVSKKVVEKAKCKKVSYSLNNIFSDYHEKNFDTQLLGKINLENICGAFALCKELGLSEEIIAKAVKTFRGIKTRLEFLGEFNGRFLYWDIAQHPQKVKGSLSALREQYLKNKIICVYDPATTGLKYKESLNWFRNVFDYVDQVIVGKVSYLSGVRKKERVTGKDIVEAISETQKNVFYQPINEEIVNWILKDTGKGNVIIFMSSAGKRFTELIKKTIDKLKKHG